MNIFCRLGFTYPRLAITSLPVWKAWKLGTHLFRITWLQPWTWTSLPKLLNLTPFFFLLAAYLLFFFVINSIFLFLFSIFLRKKIVFSPSLENVLCTPVISLSVISPLSQCVYTFLYTFVCEYTLCVHVCVYVCSCTRVYTHASGPTQ